MRTLEYFSKYYKLFLGSYKSQFSGTAFFLVEKLILLVYGLFKNLKTLNVAIYITQNWAKVDFIICK